MDQNSQSPTNQGSTSSTQSTSPSSPQSNPDIAAIFGDRGKAHTAAVTGVKPETQAPTQQQQTPVIDTPDRQQAAQQPSAQQPARTYTQEEVDRLLAASRQPAQQPAQQQPTQGQQQQPMQLTQEQFNQKYGIPQVTDQHIAQLFGEDPKQSAQVLNTLLMQAAKSGALLAQGLINPELTKFQSEFSAKLSPLEQIHQERVEASLKAEFAQFAPDLKDEEPLLREISEATAARIKAQTFPFPPGWGTLSDQGKKEFLYTHVANTARQLLKGRIAQGTQAAQSAPPVRQMAPVAMGGKAGQTAARPKGDIELIFGSK